MFRFPLQSESTVSGRRCFAGLLIILCAVLAGCGHFHPMTPTEYVYVTVKHMYLRDRVAVVANRVAEVINGEKLEVLEHGRRFLRVKTPQGQMGWIEDHAVLDQNGYDQFTALAKAHAGEKPVANAILYNELYIHLEPGRKTQRFYLLPANTHISLLERASVPRNPTTTLNLAVPPPVPAKAVPGKKSTRKAHPQSFDSRFAPAVPMEDWWLVRTADGRVGWMLSRDLEMDVPQDVAQYSENEKMVGAYVLRTVDDPASGKPDGKVPEYVTVLTSYKQGLPYDFDQVRVFTWDARRHRYGIAFRLRDIAGFFPVTVHLDNAPGPNGPQPTFSFRVAANNDISLDPQTGKAHAAQLVTMTYRVEGNLVRRVLPPGQQNTAVQSAHAAAAPVHRRREHRRR